MGWDPAGSHSRTAGATLYEVPGDHAVIYEDDPLQFGSEKLGSQVAGRNDANGSIRETHLLTGDPETDVDDLPEQTISRLTAAEAAIPQRQDADSEAGAEASGDVREVSPPDADGQPASPPVRVDLQQEGITRTNPYARAPEQESVAPPDQGDVNKPAEYPEPVDAALAPAAERPRGNRRRLVLVLIPVLLIVAAIIGASVLAALLLSPADEMPTAETETATPTPDVGSTIAAAVAVALAVQTTPSPANLASARESAAPPNTPPQSVSLPQVPQSPPMPSQHVNWEQPPQISETGDLVFRARIDKGANFVPAGPRCGFGNVSLADNADAFYGFVIPRSMAAPCGTGPSDLVSNRYYYSDNLLTVTVQLSSEIADQPGLMVCLWTGGGTDEENHLLDCAPARRPDNG